MPDEKANAAYTMCGRSSLEGVYLGEGKVAGGRARRQVCGAGQPLLSMSPSGASFSPSHFSSGWLSHISVITDPFPLLE